MRVLLFLIIAGVMSSHLAGCSLVKAWEVTSGPSDSVYKEQRLIDCSAAPNCISTQASRVDHMIVPFTYSKPVAEAVLALKEEMLRIPRTRLIKEDGNYLHFECRSLVLKLADDVEFLFDDEHKTLQFRSASRFGYSDWGGNRKRMEEIRNKILGRI